MKKEKICFWCGKDHSETYFGHQLAPTKCKAASNKASRLLKSGVPPWVLMRILEVKGVDALWRFEAAALEVFPNQIIQELQKEKRK